jgi:hypothetical protein
MHPRPVLMARRTQGIFHHHIGQLCQVLHWQPLGGGQLVPHVKPVKLGRSPLHSLSAAAIARATLLMNTTAVR